MGHVWRDYNAVARVRDASLVADREGQFAADHDRDLLLRMVVHVGDRVGLEGDEVRHHRVGGDRLEGDAGHEVERGKVAEAGPAAGLVGGFAGSIEVGHGQEAADLTRAATFFSTAGVHFVSANDTGHISPSSRFAGSWNSSVE